MSNFVLLTDSACDIKPEILNEWGVDFINLSFRFEGEDKEYSNDEMEIKTFYDRMRKGETAKTSAINPETFSKKIEEILSQGNDVLYIGFSSGLSTTFNSARIAAGELEEKYPEYKWLIKNAHKYGFIERYPKGKEWITGYAYEPWHYRYVGVEAATKIKEEEITFEEYAVKYLGYY